MSASAASGTTHSTRPTWAEISLGALKQNFSLIQQHVAPKATVCAVVKADAYGHGGAQCALALERAGAKWFGVTCTDEGVELRQAGVAGGILLMSGFWRGEESAVIEHKLTPAIWDASQIESLERAAQALAATSVPVHLKLDTGMTRLGLPAADVDSILQALQATQYVTLEGVMTHLASAEVLEAPDVAAQIERFENALRRIENSGLKPSYFHLANSAAIVTREQTWKNMVRPGLSLYGYYLPIVSVVSGTPNPTAPLPVKPVLTWKTRVMSVRDVPAQQAVGYNGGFRTQKPSRLAVLPVGYGDGLSRSLSNRGRVIVGGDYAAIVGAISMDLTMIDVTGIAGVAVGDEVILIGESGACRITAQEHASHSGTIPYEVLCNIGKRVPRVYVD